MRGDLSNYHCQAAQPNPRCQVLAQSRWSPPALCCSPAAERRAYLLKMMQACRRAAGALASTSLPADTLRASLPAACQRLYHKNVRCPAGARAAPTRSGCAARPDVTCWSLLAAL